MDPIRQRLRAADHVELRQRGGSVRWMLVLIGLSVYTVAYWLLLLLGSLSPEYRTLLGDAGVLPVGAAAALLAWLAARSPCLDPATRRAWRHLALAVALYWLGDAIWAIIEVGFGRDPFPSIADLAYLAFYPVLLWALLQFPHTVQSRTEQATFWLDTLTVVVGGSMVVWHFVLRPAVLTVPEHPLSGILATAYPAGDLMLLLGLTITVFREQAGGSRRALSILALALMLMVVSDVAYSIDSLGAGYLSGDWQDGLWMTAQALVALAAVIQVSTATTPVAAPTVRSPRAFSFVPYLSVAVGYCLVLALADVEWATSLGAMIAGALILTMLVVARQYVAVRENADLHAERARRRSEVRFWSMVQNASDVTLVLDPDLRVTYCSPAITRIFGYDTAEIEGQQFNRLIHPDDHPNARALIAAVVAGMVSGHDARWRLRHRNGAFLHTEVVITDLTRDPAVAGLVFNMRDVTERVVMEEQLAHQAVHDLLTGLPNQVLYRDRLRHALQRVARQRRRVTILLIDLDQFKHINEALGRTVGDEVLRQVADRVGGVLREADTVARFSGDEFAVLLDESTDDPEAVAARILASLQLPFSIAGHDFRLTACAGVVTGATDSADADAMLSDAGLALHHAKQAGAGRVCRFAPEMREATLERLELEQALRRAVEEEQFELHYQPYITLAGGHISGAEALVRWRHPTRGMVSPGMFIPLAEETGLIVPLGLWVLREACAQVVRWCEAGTAGPRFSISINLSACQLGHPSLVEDVRRVIFETGIDPAQLVLEITESAVMRDPDQAATLLESLRALGLRLAVDDFGTGQSSLAYLRRFPINVLKIDKSFVDVVGQGGKETALVRSIVAMSRSLNLRTVAEGIEQPEQVVSLRHLGCDTGQGFYFSKPLPADQFVTWVAGTATRLPEWSPLLQGIRRSA